MKCGIVTTSCIAAGSEVTLWWLKYHLKMGIDTIYLYVHEKEVKVKEMIAKVKAESLDGNVFILEALVQGDDVNVVSLQEKNARDGIKRGKEACLDWIFHIDDDELLYLTQPNACGPDDLEKAICKSTQNDANVFNIRLDNLEVQKCRKHVANSRYNYFIEENNFKLRVGLHADGSRVSKYEDPRFYIHGGNPATGGSGLTGAYLSYWNGKSGGKVATPGLRPCGVHFFASEISSKTDVGHCRAQDLVVLHYPFCHFYTWRHKFNVLDSSQRSNWGHYKSARTAIMDAYASDGAGEQGIKRFYEETVTEDILPPPKKKIKTTQHTKQDVCIGIHFPHDATTSQQHWRTGVYALEDTEQDYTVYKKTTEPVSFLYFLPAKQIWLIGSSPGSSSGAAVVYDQSLDPTRIRHTWHLFDGTHWQASTIRIGLLSRSFMTDSKKFAYIQPGRILDDDERKDDDHQTLAVIPQEVTKAKVLPDHAKLAAIVLASLSVSGSIYERTFWEAVVAAASRESPEELADCALERSLIAGARAMGASPIAASLVAERLHADDIHKDKVRAAIKSAQRARLTAILKDNEAVPQKNDLVFLAMPGVEHAQSWRAGLYSRCKTTKTYILYRRIRENKTEHESYLYNVPKRGMWLLGTTPGSTTGGLVAYDKSKLPHHICAAWHLFDGKAWIQAPGVSLTPILASKSSTTSEEDQDRPDEDDANTIVSVSTTKKLLHCTPSTPEEATGMKSTKTSLFAPSFSSSKHTIFPRLA